MLWLILNSVSPRKLGGYIFLTSMILQSLATAVTQLFHQASTAENAMAANLLNLNYITALWNENFKREKVSRGHYFVLIVFNELTSEEHLNVSWGKRFYTE